jgi:flagellar hook-length control protein FliK
MNATPVNINPANAIQAQSGSPRQQDAASTDTPFSQMLSSEIAQNRQRSDARQDADAQTGKASAPEVDRQAESGAETVRMVDVLAEAEVAVHAKSEEALTTDLLAPVVVAATPAPEAVIALPFDPDVLKPALTGASDTDDGQETGLANALPFQASRKGRAELTALGEQATDPARATEKNDPALLAKADPKAAMTAALASSFAGQLAAVRQSDAMKTGEFASDLMSNPAMRPTSYAPLETPLTPNDIASPRLSPALGTPAWGQALGEKIVWMANASQQTATLTLNPPNMGPLQIVLNVSNEQATASFFSAQPEVRQALEAAFPRLRDMMNEAGIQLEQATVSADTPRQDDPSSNRQGQRIAASFPGSEDAVTGGLQTVQMPVRLSGRGLVDTFA